jgi:linoleate 8R-lipoxygenase / 9,12-octadecadienoate 8-hydroperoxide 8R-isomerase
LALAFTCIFYDGDPTKSFPLRQAARTLARQLGKPIEFNVRCVNTTGFVATILDHVHKHDTLTDYGVHLVRALLENEQMTVKDAVYTNILPTAVGMVTNQSQVFSQCLDITYRKAKNTCQRYKGYLCGTTLRLMTSFYISKYMLGRSKRYLL